MRYSIFALLVLATGTCLSGNSCSGGERRLNTSRLAICTRSGHLTRGTPESLCRSVGGHRHLPSGEVIALAQQVTQDVFQDARTGRAIEGMRELAIIEAGLRTKKDKKYTQIEPSLQMVAWVRVALQPDNTVLQQNRLVPGGDLEQLYSLVCEQSCIPTNVVGELQKRGLISAPPMQPVSATASSAVPAGSPPHSSVFTSPPAFAVQQSDTVTAPVRQATPPRQPAGSVLAPYLQYIPSAYTTSEHKVRNWLVTIIGAILVLDLAVNRKKSVLCRASKFAGSAAVRIFRWVTGKNKPRPATDEVSEEELLALSGELLEGLPDLPEVTETLEAAEDPAAVEDAVEELLTDKALVDELAEELTS